ncbi:hypothetical protein BOX37_00815 [Nocardia mangyaensis]|uniref:WXG100 family type VII secretion target n=1 Tax=Nocardia mangyaensis TaxID=2213200 RepID=A0A1J0VL60_9NOCA|nr:hypothetical protein BOX37_00815 [Nocardia mangyaensis]
MSSKLSTYNPSAYPIDKLTTPTSSDPVPDFVELIIAGNGVSLTYYANMIIKGVTGTDLIGTITNKLSGDWAALQQSAGAIRNLTEYNTAYHNSIDTAMSNVEDSWKGNAADSARDFFSELTAALDSQIDPMNEVADALDEFALASYGMANGIAGVVQYLGDLVIQLVVTWAAQVAAASSVVGAPAVAALKAVEAAILAFMALKVVQIISMIGNIVNGAEAMMGYLHAGGSAIQAAEVPELASSSYDHPGV